MKVCIIGGAGHIGYVLNELYRFKDVKLCAIAPGPHGEDINAIGERIRMQGISAKVYEDYKIMFEQEKPDIAVVTCFFCDHAIVGIEALKRGIHVFSDKPVATTLEDLEALKKVYCASNANYCAMFGLRYVPWFFTAKRIIDEGAVGEIRILNAQMSYKLGKRGEHYKKRELYGGTIPWVGSHAIDWLYWFSNSKFKSVYATHSALHNKDHEELESSALCDFTFDNKVFGSVSLDYLRPENAPTHEDDRLRIVGTGGVMEISRQKVYLINDRVKGIVELPLMVSIGIFEDFLNGIQGKETGSNGNGPDNAFVVTEACLKARMSADEHRIVFFD